MRVDTGSVLDEWRGKPILGVGIGGEGEVEGTRREVVANEEDEGS